MNCASLSPISTACYPGILKHRCSSLDAHAKSIAKTGELDLIAAGIVARVTPTSQQKSAIKTKVFELSKFAVGTEKKEAA